MSKLNFVHARGYRQVGQGHFGHIETNPQDRSHLHPMGPVPSYSIRQDQSQIGHFIHKYQFQFNLGPVPWFIADICTNYLVIISCISSRKVIFTFEILILGQYGTSPINNCLNFGHKTCIFMFRNCFHTMMGPVTRHLRNE